MQRWSSPTPIPLPIDFGDIVRLDLEFVNVRRDGGSFSALVFVNPDNDIAQSDTRKHPACVGSFTVFSRGECWGEEGHCDWEKEPVSAFDRRGPHHLTPISVTMDITSALQRIGNPDTLEVIVHAARRSDPGATEGVLVFDSLKAFAYR
jgi:hypothetical protein